jgi:hypothetical protein
MDSRGFLAFSLMMSWIPRTLSLAHVSLSDK